MYALMLIVMSLLLTDSPGPLDAYKANYASLKTELTFEFRAGEVDFRKVDPEAAWSSGGLPIVENPARSLSA